MSKILIVEDEEAIADLEKDYLELSGFEVEIENRGDVGLKRALEEDYDLFILDLMLPEVDGFEICREIRNQKNTPIIMVSAKKDDIDKIRGLGLGADDYMTKPFSLLVLISKVNACMRRASVKQEGQLLISQDIQVQRNTMQVYQKGEPVILSKKELQLLIYLMENAGRIVTKEQILEHVWDMDGQFVEENTVTVNISRLKSKLQTKAIENVRGLGYLWTEKVRKE